MGGVCPGLQPCFAGLYNEACVDVGVILVMVVFSWLIGSFVKFFKLFGKFHPGFLPDAFYFGWSGYGHGGVELVN